MQTRENREQIFDLALLHLLPYVLTLYAGQTRQPCTYHVLLGKIVKRLIQDIFHSCRCTIQRFSSCAQLPCFRERVSASPRHLVENGCEMHIRLEIHDPPRDTFATAANVWEHSSPPILWDKNCWDQMPEIRNMHFDLFLMTLFVE